LWTAVAIDPAQNWMILDFGQNIGCEIIHTPGHSTGSISLFFNSEKAIFTGDSLPVPNDMPIYDDIAASVGSIRKLRNLKDIEVLLSSWDDPVRGRSDIDRRIGESLAYLRRIHEAVLKWSGQGNDDLMELCRRVVSELGLPPLAANPIVARSIAANLAALDHVDLLWV